MVYSQTGNAHRRGVAKVLGLAGMAAISLGGCSGKSFLDPSTAGSGRWEATPVSMPILNRIAAIEDESGDLVEYSDPLPGDLIPQPKQYRVGPGDTLRITLWDLITRNQAEDHEVEVDARGMIELPQLGRLYVNDKTTPEITEVIRDAMRRLVTNPLASVVSTSQRQQTYTLVGGVDRPGPYFVQRANFRLLEALTVGGKFDETAEEVHIIRQVALSEETTGNPTSPPAPPSPTGVTPPADAKPILDIIDELAPPKKDPPSPSAFHRQPDAGSQPKPPAINLPEDQPETARQDAPARAGDSRWVFVNGRWTQLVSRATGSAGTDSGTAEEELLTQRVIRVPMADLLAGKQSVNIVVRPGDVIRVPTPPSGVIYISGQVARPGVYGLPANGMTLMAAIRGAAGGYSSIAIPERIDLTRRVGKDRQSTIMLDGAAIARREQPDIFLKPNDEVVVGTNFWALPLAVIRSGLRASYGFGFVLDRNLSNDIFGPEAVRQVQ